MKSATSLIGRMIFAASVGILALSQPASSSIVTNGSFEGVGTLSGFNTLNSVNNSISGWTVSSGSVDWIGTYWQASQGKRSIDLNGNSPGTIYQDISGLIIGKLYKLSFALSGNPDDDPQTKNLQVSIASLLATSLLENVSYTLTGANSASNMNWLTLDYEFIAQSAEATLQFASLTPDFWGPALDNVSISAVPVPPALLLLGTGILGLVARRRKKRTA